MEQEQWKAITGFENYQVSNLGGFRKAIKQGYTYPKGTIDTHGYKQVSINGHLQLLHRLVAKCFVRNFNPDACDTVNHIDENKLNNEASNLEWCTHQYNSTYGHAGSFKKKKAVIIYDNGNREYFESLTRMAEIKHIPLSSLHHLVHRGNHRFTGRNGTDTSFRVYYCNAAPIPALPKEGGER